MSLPIHSSVATARPTTLTQAVAQARHPRNHATAHLDPHREELLQLAEAGDSAETLAIGLGLIGIKIGRETMRRWLQRSWAADPPSGPNGKSRCAVRESVLSPRRRARLPQGQF